MSIGDVRKMYDSTLVYAWDLEGTDVTVTIRDVEARELTSAGGKSNKKPVLYFQGSKKGLALNKTNMRIIAGMYGYKGDEWIGKRVTLYPTTTDMGGRTVDCVRIRPGIPPENRRGAPLRDDVAPNEAARENQVAAALEAEKEEHHGTMP
jgi:hypothetical protein